MKRMKRLIILLLVCCLLSGCQVVLPGQLSEETLPPGAVSPAASAPDELRSDESVALFFRYGSEPYLAAEQRTVTQLPTQAWEQTLLHALLSGPETRSRSLSTLFPEGTRLLATSREGRTLFVTLSDEILNHYADEPRSWQDDPYWSQEVPRRRVLCMQSLAATVTENSDIDRIQVLVAKNAGSISTRLPQSYYKTTASDAPAPMITRDGSVLLTADNTLHIILTAWMQRNWIALYQYVADDGAQPDSRTFAAAMTALPQLLSCDASSASIDESGRTATFSLTATVSDGSASRSETGVIRLTRRESVWLVTPDQLTGWLEE